MSTSCSSKYHQLFSSVLSGLKLPFDRTTRRLERLNSATRPFARHRHRSSVLSPASLMIWRLIAHGTTPGDAHGLLTAWSGWEHLSHHLWPTTEIPAAPYGVLELRTSAYSGDSFVLPDGIPIESGATITELHCNNQNILHLSADLGINPFAAMREDLHSLSQWMKHDEGGHRVRALFGVTMLTKGAMRLGFMVRPQPAGVRRRFEKVFMTGLLILYTPDGIERLMNGSTPRNYPQEIWMSRGELIRRYGNRSGRVLKPGRASDPASTSLAVVESDSMNARRSVIP